MSSFINSEIKKVWKIGHVLCIRPVCIIGYVLDSTPQAHHAMIPLGQNYPPNEQIYTLCIKALNVCL